MTQRIASDGFYDHLKESEYHADPCSVPSLSSGVASIIVNGTLAQARFAHPRLNPDYEAKDSKNFDVGSVAHLLMTGKGADLHVIDAADYRTKAAQEARAEAIEKGLQPILTGQLDDVQALVAASRAQIAEITGNEDAFVKGDGELVGIATVETQYGPATLRMMADWIDRDKGIIWDYKTFQPGADPDNFARYLFREARDLQDPFYRRIAAHLLGADMDDIVFRYVVQDTNAPYPLSVIELDGEARDFAAQRSAWAIGRWAEATATGQWGGYLPRTHYVGAPNYAMIQWADKLDALALAGALDEREGEAA